MTALLAFRAATCLLALDALAALYLGGLIGPIGAGFVGAAIVASWGRDRLGLQRRGSRLGQGLVAVAALASAVDLLYLADSLLDGFVRLLLFLLLYRLFTRRSLRDARDVGFLSFFMLVAASSVTFDVGFLVVFLAFLVLGVWMFILHHVLAEAERAGDGGAPEQLPLGPALLGLSATAAGATLAITTVFFFLIPRVGQATLPLRARLGAMVSGFSERVEIGAFGAIETDGTVAMRVRFPDGPPALERLANLRWRGVAFDHFDGRGWKVLRADRSTLTPSAAGHFEVSRYRGRGVLVTQEIYLEPIGTDVVFAAPRVLALSLPAEAITVDGMGSLSVASPAARLRYTAYSELEGPPSQPVHDGPGGEPPDPGSLERYLQLPSLPPRIADLARRVSAGSDGPSDAARRLTSFLSREFRYSLTLARQTELGPLEEFLFVRRSGNCEYFATALAVMLRTIGIPARIVNGFQRGEWNPYGRYLMVRQRDAHSWVEAHVAGVGWVTFDPSPRGDPATAAGPHRIGLYLDALRMRWYRYVVNWSLHDQVTAAGLLQRETARWRQRLMETHWWRGVPGADATLGAITAAAVAALFLWRGHRRRGRLRVPPLPGFYERALRALARRDLRPAPAETAREFLGRVTLFVPACAPALARLTDGYERARFGSTPIDPEGLTNLDRCLAELERLARQQAEPQAPPVAGC